MLYAIKSDTSYVKVGISANPKGRLTELQVGHPGELTLEAWWVFADEGRAPEVEAAVHGLLASKRVRGEWFNATLQEVSDAVEKVAHSFGDSVWSKTSEPFAPVRLWIETDILLALEGKGVNLHALVNDLLRRSVGQ